MRTGAIILAAGAASRFGAPKQLLELHGETLIDRACRLAAEGGCSPVIRVLGAHAELIQQCHHPADVITVVHEKWADGMGGSLARGMEVLLSRSPDLEGVLILLCDQPGVTVPFLQTLSDRLLHSSIALSDSGEATGPPAAFSRAHFPELLSLTGDRGAKGIAKAHPGSVATLPFPEGRWDIDSEEAWREFNASGSPSV